MRIEENTTYFVPPLDREDIMEVVAELEMDAHGAGIPTFTICREVSKRLPDPKLSCCAAFEDRHRPCTTLCYVCVEILYELLQRGWRKEVGK